MCKLYFSVFFLLACLLLMISCQQVQEGHLDTPNVLANYNDLLNLKGTPQNKTDRSVFMYSDQGAWHGFALPGKDLIRPGSFVGPFLMHLENGIWANPSISSFSISGINGPNSERTKSNISDPVNHYYPNKLYQEFTIDNSLHIQCSLSFVSDRTSVIRYRLTNNSREEKSLKCTWQAETQFGDDPVQIFYTANGEGIELDIENNAVQGFIKAIGNGQVNYTSSEENYEITLELTRLGSGETSEFFLLHTFCFSASELNAEKEMLNYDTVIIENLVNSNDQNWSSRINGIIEGMNPPFKSKEFQNIAVKCVETLNTNYRGHAGFLTKGGLFPSYNYQWFHGFWAWDSWKHAVAVCQFDENMAMEQLQAMFVFQDSVGMVADCVYRDTIIENHNFRNTKPPLSAWAANAIFEKTKDKRFLIDILPAIERYHNWWYAFRDHDKDGICEYGSTDGSIIAGKWESGMDNAVRFDETNILRNSEGAWSLSQESVDLNAFLYAEKIFLSNLLNSVGDHLSSNKYADEAVELKEKINDQFFDTESGWYYDTDLFTNEKIKAKGPEGWIPLWAGIANQQQADRIIKTMLDSSSFGTYIPFPTVSADHPSFKPDRGYWRGPVWLDQVYFALKGMEKYGYEEDARILTLQLMDRLEGIKSDAPIYENYHPLSGKGMEARHFSWSAGHLLLLLTEE